MSDGDTIVQRPWGSYFKLYQESGVWVKRVEVNAGQRLSLQRHYKRSEKWIVVQGKGMAVLDGKDIPLEKGSVLDIPVETDHRIGNSGEEKLIFIEVACGEYLGEDDIIRVQDDYAR
ncbi:MAG: phosphomannose isomerase type II C-terminal cupin domain [Candidatus Omnitrophica bacterium]|nr:phosphomannose isomerase type II C-terminal cupin domain [Candidatus Omnitrophota bacterium]